MYIVLWNEEFKLFATESKAKAFAEELARTTATPRIYIFLLDKGLGIDTETWVANGCPTLLDLPEPDSFFKPTFGA